jgi:hypothetical protein
MRLFFLRLSFFLSLCLIFLATPCADCATTPRRVGTRIGSQGIIGYSVRAIPVAEDVPDSEFTHRARLACKVSITTCFDLKGLLPRGYACRRLSQIPACQNRVGLLESNCRGQVRAHPVFSRGLMVLGNCCPAEWFDAGVCIWVPVSQHCQYGCWQEPHHMGCQIARCS